MKSPLWMHQAACRSATDSGEVSEWAFVTEPTARTEKEFLTCKTICAQCPVATQCLKMGIDDREAYGLYGGIWFDSGVVSPADAAQILANTGVSLPTTQEEHDQRYASDLEMSEVQHGSSENLLERAPSAYGVQAEESPEEIWEEAGDYGSPELLRRDGD